MIPKQLSIDIRNDIYGYTKLHLWIYEVISMDIRVASYRYLKRN